MKNKVIAIRYHDFLKYGCANCGCDIVLQGFGIGGFGTCEECGQKQIFFDDGVIQSNIGFDDGNGGFYYPKVQEHPRKGTPWHPYEWPDPRPDGGGEFWRPRGIGYDLSGFVKSKKAGERILQMVKDVLGIENPASWLDWREHEPKWIQFKFQEEEFDLEKLYEATKDTDVLTEEILRSCALKER